MLEAKKHSNIDQEIIQFFQTCPDQGKEGMELMHDYHRIKGSKRRRSFLELVRSLAHSA